MLVSYSQIWQSITFNIALNFTIFYYPRPFNLKNGHFVDKRILTNDLLQTNLLDLPSPINQSQIINRYKYKSQHVTNMLRPSKLIIINWDKSKKMNSLQATVKDMRKVSDKSVSVVKGAMYYAFIPAILYFGLKTVDWAQFTPQQAWCPKDNSNYFKSSCIFYCVHSFILSFLTTPYIIGTCSFISFSDYSIN